uniref:CIPKG n=1 Tax=Arundo donax TaxID=35708 RepID=A0A0A9DRM5_ARUDO
MSASPGRTSSAQNLLKSSASPASCENSTTATSAATSSTSTVTASRPFVPSAFASIRTFHPFPLVTSNPRASPTASSFSTTVAAGARDVNTVAAFCSLSKSPERSNPEDMEDMSWNALHVRGEMAPDLLLLLLSSPPSRMTPPSSSSSNHFLGETGGDVTGGTKPFLNHGVRMISGMEMRLAGSTTSRRAMSRRASPETHGGTWYSALKIFWYILA